VPTSCGTPESGPLRIANFRHRVWQPATTAASLDGLRIHDLRHTAVALWIAAGASPKEVAVRAGHSSVSFTLDRYGHLYPESDTALRNRLNAIFAAGQDEDEGVVIDLPARTPRPQRGPAGS
jgi:integrase